MKKKETSEFARREAARVWRIPKTEKINMNSKLAEAFATILDGILSEPWLDNATTGELLEEVTTRIYLDGKLDYRTSERHGEVREVLNAKPKVEEGAKEKNELWVTELIDKLDEAQLLVTKNMSRSVVLGREATYKNTWTIIDMIEDTKRAIKGRIKK
jgi:hypothetical protein